MKGKGRWGVGGSSGVGGYVARERLSRGARVAISARREDELNEVSGGTMLVVTADVPDAASLTAAASRIREELGPIDLCILSAGYWEQMSADAWDTERFNRHVQVNLTGMSTAVGAVLPAMLARRAGVSAVIPSAAGPRGTRGGHRGRAGGVAGRAGVARGGVEQADDDEA